jgi:flagellin-like protein
MNLLYAKQRRAISTIIATIIVVAMTIVAAGLLYTYFTTTASRAQNTAQIQVSASIAVPGGQGTGTAVVTVTNSGSLALTGLSISGPIVPASVTWNPAPSSTSPLAPGVSTSTNFQTASSVTSGVEYTITIVATFANGATQTQVVTVTAQ